MKRSYIIKKIILITYDDKKIVFDIIDKGIKDRPIKLVKEEILDTFSTMKDKPVKVKIEKEYV